MKNEGQSAMTIGKDLYKEDAKAKDHLNLSILKQFNPSSEIIRKDIDLTIKQENAHSQPNQH